MKLNRFNPRNIKVRRGGGGRIPGGRGGSIGCGTIVIVAIAYFAFGADPMQTLGVVQGVQDATNRQQIEAPDANDPTAVCTQGPYALEACNALDSLNQTWEPILRAERIRFEQPTLTLYSAAVRSGCGNASSAMGPFYCPADYGIYLDTSFYTTMERQMGAGGDFARYYVMAHEFGHHIQTLTGLSSQVRSAQAQDRRNANDLQVLSLIHI